MEKRRIRLEINGVVCGLITQESGEYMESLADEVGKLMKEILDASPFITREAAALTAALSYCDDAKKGGKRISELQERVDELEVEAELWQEERAQMAGSPKEDPVLLERVQALEAENTALAEAEGKMEEYRRRAAELEDENAALRRAVSEAEAASNKEDADLREQAEALKKENEELKTAAASRKGPEKREEAEKAPKPAGHGRNPLRYEDEFRQEGIVSFFEKN